MLRVICYFLMLGISFQSIYCKISDPICNHHNHAESQKLPASHHRIRLYDHLFNKSNYNPKLRPITFFDQQHIVQLAPLFERFTTINSAAEAVTVSYTMQARWTDYILRWNASDYGCTKYLILPVSDVWFPDIYVVERINTHILTTSHLDKVQLYSNGTVSAYIPKIVTIDCNFNVQWFPFDEQSCKFTFSSHSYQDSSITLQPANLHYGKQEFEYYNADSEWDLDANVRKRKYIFDGTAYLEYTFTIKRRSLYYIVVLILPTSVITNLAILGFFTPFNIDGSREERITLAITTMLSLGVMLIVVSGELPRSSNAVSVLGVFVLGQISIVFCAAIFSVFVMLQHRNWILGYPMPLWSRCLVSCTTKNFSDAEMLESQSVAELQATITHQHTDVPASESTQVKHIVAQLMAILDVWRREHYQKLQRKKLLKQLIADCDRLDRFGLAFFLCVSICCLVITLSFAFD